jgi:hypothetical protein
MNSAGETMPRWGGPAHQGLDPRDARVVHHRLVVQQQLVAQQALAQVHRAGRDRRLHLRVEEAQGVAPVRLGLVHGQIGALEQLIDRRGSPWNRVMPMLGVL